jgi:two-component system, chemotaxis family, protein-glutamate methylesterase/glutaminase
VPTAARRIIPAAAKIRVLVVDDSVVIRRLVTQALSEDPGIEVVGSASNGVLALQRIPQLNPDVITLDVEMPEMDGLETLAHVRREYKDLRIIMFSTLTRRGATATIDALMAGADDYVTKAANVGRVNESLAALRGELVPRVNQFFVRADAPRSAPVRTAPASGATSVRHASGAVPVFRPRLVPKIVAIGVSTGGPTALSNIMPRFPADFPLPIVIVQHMPPLFTRLLAERLQKQTALAVVEATEGQVVERGHVYIAPGDYHMRVRRAGTRVVIALDQAPPENSCRPAVDVLFRSVQEVYGGEALSAVLTGMGQDGLRGVELLKASGAYVVAQDEATSVVWGMPGAIARANLADAVLPIDDIVPDLLRHV